MERLKAAQDAADLQHYNDRFSSFHLVSSLDTSLKGRGNDPKMAEQVAKIRQHKTEVVIEGPAWGGKGRADEYFHIADQIRKDRES